MRSAIAQKVTPREGMMKLLNWPLASASDFIVTVTVLVQQLNQILLYYIQSPVKLTKKITFIWYWYGRPNQLSSISQMLHLQRTKGKNDIPQVCYC